MAIAKKISVSQPEAPKKNIVPKNRLEQLIRMTRADLRRLAKKLGFRKIEYKIYNEDPAKCKLRSHEDIAKLVLQKEQEQ